jgi:hypothetical protein
MLMSIRQSANLNRPTDLVFLMFKSFSAKVGHFTRNGLGRRSKMKILLLVILSLLAIGPLILYQGQKGIIRMHDEGQKDKIQMHDDAKSLKEEVLQKVPIGSSIQDAKPIMEENGFRCEMYKNGSFYETQENDPEGKGKIYHENADFLLCAKEGKPFQYVFREWRVIIVHKNDNDVVSDIFVRTWVTGP